MFYRSVQSVRQSKSVRFVLEANEKTNSCSELLAVFENWLSGCFACVRWNGTWSQCLVSALLRHGSVLTTFLFHIYLDHLAKLNCAKRLFIFIIIYADDILLIEPGCAYISTRDGRTLS